jgi:hypothetical protein
VRAFAIGTREVRFVTSALVDAADIAYAAETCARALAGELLGRAAAAGPYE